MRPLQRLNPQSRVRRRVFKAAFVLAVTSFTLYPNPVRLIQHLSRAANMNALIQPDAEGLQVLEHQARAFLRQPSPGVPPTHADVLAAVQRVVLRRLPYAFDWETWSCANYFPTVSQALALGTCDCKGRAIVAASVLARMGYTPRLVTDLSHVWVWTQHGETMSPVATASGRRVVTADDRGSRIDPRAVVSRAGLLHDMPTRLGFGVSVFPSERVAVIAAAMWFVMLRRRPHWRWSLVGAVALTGGIVTLKLNCADVENAVTLAPWVGIGLGALGLGLSRVWAPQHAQSPLPRDALNS